MKKLFLLLLAASICFFSFQSCNDNPTTTPETQSFTGTITDDFEIPIPNAIVSAVRVNQGKTTVLVSEEIIATDTTDEDGNFEFKNLPSPLGSIKIRIQHSDFKSFEEFLLSLMEKGEKNKLRIRVKHRDDCCGKIIIYTYGSDSTRLSNVEVRLNRGRDLVRKTRSNDDGRVVFEKVCPGNYWVRIAKEGYQVIEREFTLNNCDTLEFSYYLQARNADTCCNGILKVEVKNKANDETLNGSIVKLRKNGALLTTLTIKENQPVYFRELCPGNYSLLVFREGFKALEYNFTFECNDTLEYTAELEKDTCCNSWIKVFVKNQSNEPISQAKVKIWKQKQLLGYYYTSNDGVVIFRELCNGTYGFEIEREGYKSIEFQVEIGCGEGKEITKTLERADTDSCCNGLIVVHVKDKNTNGNINGAKVKLWLGNSLKQVETVYEGVAIFRNICSGEYQISIFADRYKGTEFSINLECNDTLEFTKYLEQESSPDSCCNGKIIFIVRDSSTGDYAGDVNVYLWKGNQKVGVSKTGSDNGRAVFERVCEGEYSFALSKDGYYGKEGAFRVDCNDTVEIPIKILRKTSLDTCCTAKLKIKVIDDDSTENVIENALVEIRINDRTIAEIRTNTYGWAVKEDLCAPKTYNIRVSAEGYSTQEFQINFNECKTIQETVKLKRQ